MIRQLGLTGRELIEVELYAAHKAKTKARDTDGTMDVDDQLMLFAASHNAALTAKRAGQK